MKKLLLLITVLFFGISTANAQIEKATDGDVLQFTFTPNTAGGETFALTSGMFTWRQLNGDSATRWRGSFMFDAEEGYEDMMELGLFYGKEKHHEGTTRLGTYTGWEAGLVYADDGYDDYTAFAGGVFAGANYYIANNLYLGLEARYTISFDEDQTILAPGVNGLMTIGFKL